MATKNLKCKYLYDKNYNPVYVNGAHGGINVSQEIVIHFYLERFALPVSQTFPLLADGNLGQEIPDKTEPEDLNESFVRYIESGVILNLDTAKVIHGWLGNHIKTLETLKNGKKTK